MIEASRVVRQLRAVRAGRGLTQHDVGSARGVPQSSISGWESGAGIRLATLIDWADVLGYDIVLTPKVPE